MRKPQERSEKTQQAILEAAIVIAREHGWKKTGIQEICRQAGVSVGAFYHHFQSKQEVMNKSFLLFDETLDDLFDKKKGASDDCAKPRLSVKKILLRQTRFIVTEAGPLIREYYLNILNDAKHSAVDPNRKYYRAVLSCIRQSEDKLSQQLTPEAATDLLIKFVRGSIIDWCLHDFGYDLVERLDQELDLLLAAIFITE
ncbi:MAG: TetR/AcrR family transcriptional regulator [Clostridiaceae bacterium]|nr:TetR/AcrR family transcriptional regulator [Clostridiaceae bacterium]